MRRQYYSRATSMQELLRRAGCRRFLEQFPSKQISRLGEPAHFQRAAAVFEEHAIHHDRIRRRGREAI